MKWDIFCSVVDNFGDIGVTWRLARQLVAEHDARVRLWVDDLGVFAHLCPALDPTLARQHQDGVEIGRWDASWQATEPADVVIEAFACPLPASYIEAMRDCERPVLWLNLEYLSAEDWVAGCHALPSPQAGGQQKFFFFPGFTEGTGGLLRETDLLAQRDVFRADAMAQQVFLGGLGVARRPGARLISLFAYENAGLASWLDALRDDDQPTQLLVPQGRILADVQAWVGGSPLVAGECRSSGSVQIHILPFMPQPDYDRLLWCCDLNAVRGEDSFVRAQWAGRPLLWHIYQQEEGAHFDKLEAFLALYRQQLSPAAGDALVAFWLAWNSSGSLGEPWKQVIRHWDELAAHAERWCAEQAARPNLAAALVQFYRNWL